MREPIAIAGAGRMAQALGRLLHERGQPIAAIAARDPRRAAMAARFIGPGVKAVSLLDLPPTAVHFLFAVPDDALPDVSSTLASAGFHGGVALHTSGSRGPEALAPLAVLGVSCGAFHPLQTVATPEDGVRVLPGVAFAIDGDDRAAAWAKDLAAILDGPVLRIPTESRPIYHAAAVLASNYLIALVATAVILMKEAGMEEAVARQALEPLARSSLDNAWRLGPDAALTGPIARGDIETVRQHLAALSSLPSTAALYRAVGHATLDIARRTGLSESRACSLDELLR